MLAVVGFIVEPRSLEVVTVGTSPQPLPVLHVIFPLSFVGFFVVPNELALVMPHSVLEGTTVCALRCHLRATKLLTLDKLSLKPRFLRKEESHSVGFIVFGFSAINVTFFSSYSKFLRVEKSLHIETHIHRLIALKELRHFLFAWDFHSDRRCLAGKETPGPAHLQFFERLFLGFDVK